MTLLSPPVLQALSHDANLITANQRASRTLRLDYDTAMRAASLTHWPAPSILAIDSWMAAKWHQMLVEGSVNQVLLNTTQERSLWQTIVAGDITIQRRNGLANLAMQAWARLWLHNGQTRLHEAGDSLDTRAFAGWAHQFEERCKEGSWISAPQLPARLASSIERKRVPLPATVFLAGFDGFAPAHERLFAALRNAGCRVEELSTDAAAKELLLSSAVNEAGELLTCAQWASRKLEANAATKLGVIVPGLDARRHAIEQVFRTAINCGGIADQDAFEFSLGIPLAKTTLAADALDLLRWPMEALPLETVSALLVSPFFGGSLGEPELQAAAEFDAFELRRKDMLQPEITLDRLAQLLENSPRRPVLADLLARVRAMRQAAEAERLTPHDEKTYADWAGTFRVVLEASRWTRHTRDTAVSWQTLDRWESVLDELATLDFTGSIVSADRALTALNEIATHAIFAPASLGVPIQILGPLEAAGSNFDAIWVLGAGDQTWFRNGSPNPLLSWQLQHELQMPEADETRHEQIAIQITKRLATSATSITFSYSETTEDGPQGPSPFLTDLQLQTAVTNDEHNGVLPALLHTVVDDAGLPPLPDRVVKGGARVIEDQAACPFRAFAAHRLQSTGMETRELGLDPRDRGNDVHAVMDVFWQDVRSQSELAEMSSDLRRAVLDRSIEEVLSRRAQAFASTWDTAYLQVQHRRLRSLLLPWLEKELDRPEFAVKARETSREATIGALRLNLKFDRIDVVDGDREIILDYKTGEALTSEWLGERPDSPQLPLYALLADPNTLGGVAFAQMRAGKYMSLSAFSTGTDVIVPEKKMELTFQAQIDEWRRILTRLAGEFSAGDARVDPKRYPETCRHCEQRLLCRLDISAVRLSDDEEPVRDDG